MLLPLKFHFRIFFEQPLALPYSEYPHLKVLAFGRVFACSLSRLWTSIRKKREKQDGKESGTGITKGLLRTTLVALGHVTAGVKELPIRVALLYYFVHLTDRSDRNFSNRAERKKKCRSFGASFSNTVYSAKSRVTR